MSAHNRRMRLPEARVLLGACCLWLPFVTPAQAQVPTRIETFPASEATQVMSRAELAKVVSPGMPAPLSGAQLEKSMWVPMRDGVRLSTDIYLPAIAQARLPVILIRTPYDKRGWSLGPGAQGNPEIAMFVGQGFVVAVQDTRGRYESEGIHQVSAHARNDGYDSLSWIAAQPWSNGKIGTYGCSYLGEVQYMLAD